MTDRIGKNRSVLAVTIVAIVLIGLLVFQQFWIQNLNGQINTLTVQNTQKDNEIATLTEEYNQLDISYQKILSSLEQINGSLNTMVINYSNLSKDYADLQANYQNQYNQLVQNLNAVTSLLNEKESNLTALQKTFNVLSQNYSMLLQDYDNLKELTIQLCNSFGATDGVFIQYWQMTYGLNGMITTCLANMTLYNALPTANVTVEIYGTTGTKLFTYNIPSGTTVQKIEFWSEGIFGVDYGNILIYEVDRDW
jgi:phage-related tail protein